MSVTTPSTGQKISDFSAGNVDANSYFIQANSGSTSKVTATQIGQFSNLNLLFNGEGGLNTTAKTIVGAINEVDGKDASDITYDNTSSGLNATDVNAAIDEVSAVSSFTPTSAYGTFYFKAINGIKRLKVSDPKGLAAESMTTLDFTLPKSMRPIDEVSVFDMRQPSATYTIRMRIQTDGTVQIYNYGTNTGTLNMSYTGCYI